MKIIKAVEKTHKNLGIPTVFMKLLDIANMGGFIVADRGKGKTTVLMNVVKLRHRPVKIVTGLTYAGLAKISKEIDGQSVTLINKDFSSFYTEYLRDVGVNVIANLLTDHEVHTVTGKYKLDISEAYISFLSATQPQMISRLNRTAAWESMYKDRFIRFYLFYPRGSPRYTKLEPNIPQIEMLNPDMFDEVTIPTSIKNSKEYKRIKAILERQTSEGRAGIYTDNLLKASAILNQRDVVTEGDVKFLNICSLYLVVDWLLSERRHGVSEPLVFNPDSYVLLFYIMEHQTTSKRKLKEEFKVSHQTINENMKPLIGKGIVKGTYGKDEYKLNPDFKKKYVDPVLEFYEVI